MLYISGRVYEGLWCDDQRHGIAYEKYKNGDIFQGEFTKGRPHGQGKRIWADTGEIYNG